MNYITKLLAVSVLSMILLITPVASEPPQLPMILYGTVEVNGEPAPDGTIIAAYDGTTCIGTATIGDGQYGEDPTNRLVVNEPTGDIQIYIQTPSMSGSVEAKEVLDFEDWNPGENVEFDFSAEFTGSSSGQNLNNARSSSSSSSSGLSSGTGENNDVEALPGGIGVDTGLNQEEAPPSQDTASSSGSDDPSSNGNSNTTIIIALVIGVIALIALFYGRSKNMF